MAIKLSSVRSDPAREEEGEWVNIPDLPGVRFRVRSFNYGPYKAQRSIVFARLARKYGREPVPDQIMVKELGQLYHKYILLEWDGFDVPFSPETARDVLTDPTYRTLLDHVDYAANRVGQAEVEFVEQAAGN